MKDRVYNYLCEYIMENGYPPSIREICQKMGFRSTSSAHFYLKLLDEEGRIRRSRNHNRAIEIIGSETQEGLRPLPLVGRIAAGVPITAEQHVENTIFVPKSLIRDEQSYMLQVKGDSMINAGIYDGDYLIIKPQETAEEGQIVVALVDEEATVKRLYHDGDMIRLQPENDTMEPIMLKSVHIQGIVTGLFRKV